MEFLQNNNQYPEKMRPAIDISSGDVKDNEASVRALGKLLDELKPSGRTTG